MKIRFYADESITLQLSDIVRNLTRLATSFQFSIGQSNFSINDNTIIAPFTYKTLSEDIQGECINDDFVMMFTAKPYDNNYFWEEEGNKAIISMYGWDYLTNLSCNNGAVYFVCAIIIRELAVGSSHKINTGCINDFWADKKGVDSGMRCAYICKKCLDSFFKKATTKNKKMLSEIQAVLDDVSTASRTNLDVCSFWKNRIIDEAFQVFMCHNSNEKDDIREINAHLAQEGVRTWFDEEQLRPGCLWQDVLEEQIGQIKCAAVFVGASGIGPWQNQEIRAFLSEFINRHCPVIPVILPKCSSVPHLPLFLRQFMWVDFRRTSPDPWKQLLWGITGKRQ